MLLLVNFNFKKQNVTKTKTQTIRRQTFSCLYSICGYHFYIYCLVSYSLIFLYWLHEGSGGKSDGPMSWQGSGESGHPSDPGTTLAAIWFHVVQSSHVDRGHSTCVEHNYKKERKKSKHPRCPINIIRLFSCQEWISSVPARSIIDHISLATIV